MAKREKLLLKAKNSPQNVSFKELEALAKYLPAQMPEKEVRKIVKETIIKIGVSDIKEMGKVMGALMPQVKGKADGSLVQKIVQEELKK